ncbi:amino acid adenylation domain protein [Candidatus Moduliflexus flocculans]|uniref:Amino acid adenylation domain protein n=1 Tax=Candidatus Moduliflexus flocculans TaxID=1499966 RepID=A0A081BM32_9BACT|nr:amino acid adenylation domain protein [Candidatus Moduliflexus flocculans]
MREWVEQTVCRITSLQPNHVLEIGCGTGLLLFRIAPHCQQYWGIDFSKIALNAIRQYIATPGHELPHVSLFQRTADNFEGIPSACFDVLILNSVSQHFPDIAYLFQVIEGMIHAAQPGGVLFIGDVRSLPLLKLFHLSVQLYQAPTSLSIPQLRQRVQRHLDKENEVVISPEFFLALQQYFPQITHIQILPKRGCFQNELTRFRYDVMLYMAPHLPSVPPITWIDWQKRPLTVQAIRQKLQKESPDFLGIQRIANARLMKDIRASELLTHHNIKTVGELRTLLDNIVPLQGIDPEDLWALSDDLPYQVDMNWANADPEGLYDVLFIKYEQQNQPQVKQRLYAFPTQPLENKPYTTYAHNPLRVGEQHKFIPQLREYLHEQLPDYMIPSTFILVDKFPFTPNGKIDRKALPLPDRTRPELETAYVQPHSELETTLCKLWAELLDMEYVGIYDDFFELGGDSLTATRLVSYLRSAFGVELSISDVFDAHNIATLAAHIENIFIEEIESLSEEEAQQLAFSV